MLRLLLGPIRHMANFDLLIKIQPKTIDLSTRLWGITTEFVGWVYPPEPRTEVYCFRLNFNISKLVYSIHSVPVSKNGVLAAMRTIMNAVTKKKTLLKVLLITDHRKFGIDR